MFTLAVVIFIIVGPSIILVASGYSFSDVVSFTAIKLKKTGGIYITDIGSDGKVLLDKKQIGEGSFFNRSFLVQGLSPKLHLVTVERDGFRTWEKSVSVYPNKVTEIHAVLIAEKIRFEKISDKNIIASLKKEQSKKEELFVSTTTGQTIFQASGMTVSFINREILFSFKSRDDVPQYMCSEDSCQTKDKIDFDAKIFDANIYPKNRNAVIVITAKGIFIAEFDARLNRNITKILSPEDFGVSAFTRGSLVEYNDDIFVGFGSNFYKIILDKAEIVQS